MLYNVTLEFTEDLLGTVPLDREVYTSYIAAKKADLTPDELGEELETIDEDKGKTGFHQVDGKPILYDYVLRGFFKDACGMLRRGDGTLSKKLKAYKRVIDGLVFVKERKIPIDVIGEMGTLERPLRAQTAQGERVALAYSDSVPAGSKMAFTVYVIDDKTVPRELLDEWLDYGQYRGLGQWRNGGFGRFTYTIAEA